MQIFAQDVTSYLREVPRERYETLDKLRKLCLEILEAYEESMEYGMPSYKKDGVAEVAFASQKNFIALYILKKEVLDTYRDALNMKGVSLGKSCIRYSKAEKIDFGVVEKLLVDTFKSANEICE